jgi:hypothetical protein
LIGHFRFLVVRRFAFADDFTPFRFWPSIGIDLGIWLAICLAFAPATPPTTAPTAAPSGPIIDPAAAPAAAPPTMPKAEPDSDFFVTLLALAITFPFRLSLLI